MIQVGPCGAPKIISAADDTVRATRDSRVADHDQEPSEMSASTSTRTALRERPGGSHNAVVALDYLECDVPDGMTLRQWRRDTVAVPRRRWRR